MASNQTSIRLQRQEFAGVLPYPYLISPKGLVERQDFWKGNPYKLIGFSDKPEAGEIDLSLADFLAKPEAAVGMYPVMATKRGKWFTEMQPIHSVTKP